MWWILGIAGAVLHSFLFGLMHLNNRGETPATKETYTKAEVDEMLKGAFTQEKVDAIVQDRLAREKAKFADYDSLKQFKTEHEKNLEAATQKELEAKKEYEKLKEGWTKKEQEYQGIVSKKDLEIQDMKISHGLMNEIVKQNAYAEETMALIKSQAIFDKDGNIRIKGTDANGLEVMDSVEEGVKKFLTKRPHLVKATKPGGGGTPPGAGGGGGAGTGGEDLNTLNAEMLQALEKRDTKKINELKIKIRATLAAQGTRL